MHLSQKTKKLTTLSVLTALSVVLMMLIRFPIFPAAPYLMYEPMDVPILIAAFVYGPLSGLLVTVVSSVIQGLIASADGWVGILMHFIATGTLSMAAIMVPTNLIIQPAFYGTPVEVVKPLLLPVIAPFNLIKAGINSAVTFILYKPLRKFLIKK
jgi:riboflavin transporter FmnP